MKAMNTAHTVRGKKSRTPSPLDEATVERTLVSSMAITTAPLANRAIFPVSKEIKRDPISNSSVNVSRTFVPATGASESGTDDDMNPMRPLQMLRNPNLLHVRNAGTDARRGLPLLPRAAMA